MQLQNKTLLKSRIKNYNYGLKKSMILINGKITEEEKLDFVKKI
jgi:hypothetical protein